MSEPRAHESVDPTTLAYLKERLADFAADDATSYGDVYGLELTRAERDVVQAALVENKQMRQHLQRDPICGTYYPAAEACTAAEARMQAAYEANEGGGDV